MKKIIHKLLNRHEWKFVNQSYSWGPPRRFVNKDAGSDWLPETYKRYVCDCDAVYFEYENEKYSYVF